MKIKQNIPNAITCCNLLCGCFAIVKALEGNLVMAAYLVGIAAVLDFLDGFAARLLNVNSPIGKDLDSLADMVTFGIVPGMVIYQLIVISNNLVIDGPAIQGWSVYPTFSNPENSGTYLLKYFAFIIPVFSAIRLAKFNNDKKQSDSFIGLPTPANAILVCSFPLILYVSNDDTYMIYTACLVNPYFLAATSIIMSLLLVSNIPLFALKFNTFGWAGNRIRYIFLALSALMLVFLQFVGIPLIVMLYILISLLNNLTKKTENSVTN